MPQVQKRDTKKKWIAIGVATIILVMGGISASKQALSEFSTEADIVKEQLLSNTMTFDENIVSGTDFSNRLAIIRVDGTIQSGATSALNPVGYNHQATLEKFEIAAADPTVQGIILAVNSPGGGVYESAELRDRIQAFKENTGKPVYTSFGSMSASGGYYISAETDKIFASKETVTGSIGVIMSNYNYTELMKNLGIESNVIKSGNMKDILSSSREMTPEEQELLQAYIDESFERFLEIVMNGRKMTREEAIAIADGRIFSGNQAVEKGLVDEIGYEKDAISRLAADLKLESPVVFEYQEKSTGGLEQFFPFGLKLNDSAELSEQMGDILAVVEEQQTPRAQYLYRGGH